MLPWMRPLPSGGSTGSGRQARAPIPAPPIIKQRIVKEYLRRSVHRPSSKPAPSGATWWTHSPALPAGLCRIELDDLLYADAQRRFAGQAHVELLHGDSGTLLPRILGELDRPALFWLDGHYTGIGSARTEVDSPIVAEIEALLEPPSAVMSF